jgi:Ribbon-helix-helix protein, copG family
MQTSSFNRTQIYLTAAQQGALAAMAQAQGSTSSSLIRDAIDGYIQAHQPASKLARRMAAACSWQPNSDAPSLRELRSEEREF